MTTKLNIGDEVPYTNTASKIAWARVVSFKETDARNKIWFYGTDLKTGACVYYPENTSFELLTAMKEYAAKIPTV